MSKKAQKKSTNRALRRALKNNFMVTKFSGHWAGRFGWGTGVGNAISRYGSKED